MGRDQIYHEVELGVVIGKTGKSISESQAMDHVGGYTLALDMTDFDLIVEKVSLCEPVCWTKQRLYSPNVQLSIFFRRLCESSALKKFLLREGRPEIL